MAIDRGDSHGQGALPEMSSNVAVPGILSEALHGEIMNPYNMELRSECSGFHESLMRIAYIVSSPMPYQINEDFPPKL